MEFEKCTSCASVIPGTEVVPAPAPKAKRYPWPTETEFVKDPGTRNLWSRNGKKYRLFATGVTDNGSWLINPKMVELLDIDIASGKDVYGKSIIFSNVTGTMSGWHEFILYSSDFPAPAPKGGYKIGFGMYEKDWKNMGLARDLYAEAVKIKKERGDIDTTRAKSGSIHDLSPYEELLYMTGLYFADGKIGLAILYGTAAQAVAHLFTNGASHTPDLSQFYRELSNDQLKSVTPAPSPFMSFVMQSLIQGAAGYAVSKIPAPAPSQAVDPAEVARDEYIEYYLKESGGAGLGLTVKKYQTISSFGVEFQGKGEVLDARFKYEGYRPAPAPCKRCSATIPETK